MWKSVLLIPPAVVLMLFAALMWYVALNFPFFTMGVVLHSAIPISMGLLGLFLILISSISFLRRKTTLNPLRPELASTLIKTGIYQYSRNPIYVGFVLILLGWGIFLHNLVSVFCVIVFVLYMNHFQILYEEKSLEQKFGAEFEVYKRSVNRWL